MTKKKKRGHKSNLEPKRRGIGKKGKKDQENPVTQAKMFCTEAASHEKSGNYNRALYCYNLPASILLTSLAIVALSRCLDFLAIKSLVFACDACTM